MMQTLVWSIEAQTTLNTEVQSNLNANVSQRKYKDRSYSKQYNLVTFPNMMKTLVWSIKVQTTLNTEVPLPIFAFHMKFQQF